MSLKHILSMTECCAF